MLDELRFRVGGKRNLGRTVVLGECWAFGGGRSCLRTLPGVPRTADEGRDSEAAAAVVVVELEDSGVAKERLVAISLVGVASNRVELAGLGGGIATIGFSLPPPP